MNLFGNKLLFIVFVLIYSYESLLWVAQVSTRKNNIGALSLDTFQESAVLYWGTEKFFRILYYGNTGSLIVKYTG